MPNTRIIYVSKCKPCGTSSGSDIELFKANAKMIGDILSPTDIILCDKVFSGNKLSKLALDNNFQIVAGIKKSKKRKLTDSENSFNDILSSNRSKYMLVNINNIF